MISLIGLPGSGKSTVGRQLARRLQLTFLDSDHVIEERLGCSIRDYFEREGEAFKPRYKKLLAAGGSQSPTKILANAGIDVRQASFWQGGYDVIEELVSELEKLPVT